MNYDEIISNILQTLTNINNRITAIESVLGSMGGTAISEANINASDIANTEDAICEVTENIEPRISDIEDAICELTEG